MERYPRGTVAFLFTDIEGSTRLWRDHRAAMERAYARHDAVLRDAIARATGYVYKVIGDAIQAAFPTATAAVAAALERSSACSSRTGGAGTPEPLRVRMAMHAGAAEERDGDYFGPALNRVARCLRPGTAGRCCSLRPRPSWRATVARGTSRCATWASTGSRTCSARAHLPAAAPGAAGRLPAAEDARTARQQPARPADPVDRPRDRARRSCAHSAAGPRCGCSR